MRLVTNNNLENTGYLVLWVFSVAYSIYNVILVSAEIKFNEQKLLFLDYGWHSLGKYKDVSDDEWRLALVFLKLLCPWITVHLIVAQLLRHNNYYQYLSAWYITISLSFCFYTFGICTLFILIQPCLSIFLISFNNRILIWIVNILLIIIINAVRYLGYLFYTKIIDEDYYHMLLITISWITMKSLSASLDLHQHMRNSYLTNEEILKILAYILYLPTLLFGPVQLYNNFNRTYVLKEKVDFCERLKCLSLNLLRYIGWLFFTEFALHFVYVTALQYHLKYVSKSFWAVYGFGYCMGQFFHLKYVVMYGLTRSIMQFECIESIPTPKCIGRIHLYSHMWKYFDYGLYKFLVKYIYIPTGGNRSKNLLIRLFSSFLCFSFVFIWHGMQLFIFFWSLFNFLGIAIENVSTVFSKSNMFENNIANKLSQNNLRRFKAFIAAPLMIMSAISNFLFFGGMEVGLFFVQKLIEAPWYINITLYLVVYTLCQVSTECTNRESKRSHFKKL